MVRPAERTTPKPAWRLLLVIMAVMGTLLAIIERLVLPPSARIMLQLVVSAGGLSAIAMWFRCNRAAIALDEWRKQKSSGATCDSMRVRVYDPWFRSTPAGASMDGPRRPVHAGGDEVACKLEEERAA
jgi:hypothetical protein